MLASVDDLRAYLHTQGGGASTDGELLGSLLAAADARVKGLRPDRTLEPTPALVGEGDAAADTADPVAMTFHTTGRIVRVPDLRDVVSVEVNGRATTGYTLRGRPGQPAWWLHLGGAGGYASDDLAGWGFGPGLGGPAADREVVVTGRWGPVAVDPAVREAVLIWAARVYQERAARWSDSRVDAESGVQSYFRTVPASIKATLDGLQVPGV